jgi:integrase
VSTATLRRRLSSVSGLFGYLQATGVVAVNPVPRGLPSRREKLRPSQPVPLVSGTRRLPRVLSPAEVDALTAALRTHRHRAMVAAMVLGGLRRCEVLGLRPDDLRTAERRVFVAEGEGGHQRLLPVSGRFFTEVGAYLDLERSPPRLGTDTVFVALKGLTRGRPLTAEAWRRSWTRCSTAPAPLSAPRPEPCSGTCSSHWSPSASECQPKQRRPPSATSVPATATTRSTSSSSGTTAGLWPSKSSSPAP